MIRAPLPAIAAPTMHAHWRSRIDHLLAQGRFGDASILADLILADLILDDLFPKRWS